LRGTLLKRGFPSNSPPKTFNVFGRVVSDFYREAVSRSFGVFLKEQMPLAQKILKVFGKGFGEKPFFRKVLPDKNYGLL